MNVIVLKFGGTSVADISKINNVANIVEKQLMLTIKKIQKLDKVKTKVNVIRIENNL